jgi:hypothetical protein
MLIDTIGNIGRKIENLKVGADGINACLTVRIYLLAVRNAQKFVQMRTRVKSNFLIVKFSEL